MPLVVEDGTGVTGANSYSNLESIRAYGTARGHTLGEDVPLTANAMKAMDWLEGEGLGLLSLSFPLTDNLLCGTIKTAEVITRLSNAVAQLCIEQSEGIDLAPSRDTPFVKTSVTGPLTEVFSEKSSGGDGSSPVMPAVKALIQPLQRACGKNRLLTTRA